MGDNWRKEAYKFQNDYNNVFAEWRTFDRDHKEYIKSTIGLMLFGIQDAVETPPSNVVNYYHVYSEENQKVIDLIFNDITKKCNHGEIYLSCTHLFGKTGKEEIFNFPVLRYSQSPLSQIYFTEVTGRYYENWNDFLSSNQLPPCEFIAPRDGLYSSSTPIYEAHKSPAASTKGKFLNVTNKVMAVGSLAAAGASFCAFAPVTLLTVGVGMSAFGVGQSVATLRDRRSHGQSIGLDNRESLFSYGTIITAGLSGVSTAAFANMGRISRTFSNYSNTITRTCQVLNASVLVLDSSFLFMTAYDFIKKLKAGTITSRDVFDLSLQLFLVCGSIVQARDMHRLIEQSRFSPPEVMNRKLTRTQKRNLQKRRAKARARGEFSVALPPSSEVSNKTRSIGENDVYSSLKMFSLRVGSLGVNVMMHMYPRSEVILNYFYDLRDLLKATFVDRTMNLKEFFQQVFYHSRNLCTIIEQDVLRMREILRRFIPNPLIYDNEVIAQNMNNEMDRINEVADESIPMLEPEVLENTETQNVENDQTVDTDDNLILKFVCKSCTKYKLTNDTADAQVSLFHNLLIFTANYVDESCVRLFDETFYTTSRRIGEEKATMMVSALGRKTGNDFYPSVAFLEKVLEDSKTMEQEFMKHFAGIECEQGICSPLAQEIFEQYAQLMNLMYAQVKLGNGIGIRRMVCLHKDISSALAQKLCDDYRKVSSDSRSLFEENVGILGQALVEEMMMRIEMPTTESGFFQTALKSLDVDDIISSVKSKNIISSEEFIQPEVSPGPERQEEKSCEEVIVKLVGDLFAIVKERESGQYFTSKVDLFISVSKFVVKKFLTDMKEDERLYQELKNDLHSVGDKLMKTMLESIGMYASRKSVLFKSKVEVLGNESNLKNMADEFLKLHQHSRDYEPELPKIFETTIGDDGFTTYKITCDQSAPDESFCDLVFELFQIKINKFESQIQRDKRCVVIKFKNKIMTFTFPGEENIALVILADLDHVYELE